MMIISMAYVTPSFVSERKTVTRRAWTPLHADRFNKGDIVKAYSKSPQWKGVEIGKLRLTEKPYRQRTGVNKTPGVGEGYDKKISDFYEAEGFGYLDEQYARITNSRPKLWDKTVQWIEADTEHWVVPFEIIEIHPEAWRFNTDEEILRCVEKLCEVLV